MCTGCPPENPCLEGRLGVSYVQNSLTNVGTGYRNNLGSVALYVFDKMSDMNWQPVIADWMAARRYGQEQVPQTIQMMPGSFVIPVYRSDYDGRKETEEPTMIRVQLPEIRRPVQAVGGVFNTPKVEMGYKYRQTQSNVEDRREEIENGLQQLKQSIMRLN